MKGGTSGPDLERERHRKQKIKCPPSLKDLGFPRTGQRASAGKRYVRDESWGGGVAWKDAAAEHPSK